MVTETTLVEIRLSSGGNGDPETSTLESGGASTGKASGVKQRVDIFASACSNLAHLPLATARRLSGGRPEQPAIPAVYKDCSVDAAAIEAILMQLEPTMDEPSSCNSSSTSNAEASSSAERCPVTVGNSSSPVPDLQHTYPSPEPEVVAAAAMTRVRTAATGMAKTLSTCISSLKKRCKAAAAGPPAARTGASSESNRCDSVQDSRISADESTMGLDNCGYRISSELMTSTATPFFGPRHPGTRMAWLALASLSQPKKASPGPQPVGGSPAEGAQPGAQRGCASQPGTRVYRERLMAQLTGMRSKLQHQKTKLAKPSVAYVE